MPGGLWEDLGASPGNRNAFADSSELIWVEPFGERTMNESASIWMDYIEDYVRSSRSSMAQVNSAFRYQYGLKTFVDYLQTQRQGNNETPELAGAPQQPMQAVKDAVAHLATTVEALRSYDRISLEVYSTHGRHEIDLTQDYANVANRLMSMQAAHYDSFTNIGAGIKRGIEELTSPRANPSARKVMILLTDGNANIGCDGCTSYNPGAGSNYAREMAEAAAAADIQLFTVSVGASADVDLMEELADLGGGTHFHAEGTIEQYSDQLDAIFRELGGTRPVVLVK
jgi:hypothetical protein